MRYSENTAWWLKGMEKKQDSVGRTLKARLYFWESNPLLAEAGPAFPPWSDPNFQALQALLYQGTIPGDFPGPL